MSNIILTSVLVLSLQYVLAEKKIFIESDYPT
jgi:hypothetical protein